eukprot:scaffold8150_cov116-Isochrysis_galbana.AAC.11
MGQEALRRFAELSLRYEESISRMAREKQDRDTPFPKADKFNNKLEPLTTLNPFYTYIYIILDRTLRASGDSAGHPAPEDPTALTPLPHYLPTPFPYSGHFLWGGGSKLRALQQPGV